MFSFDKDGGNVSDVVDLMSESELVYLHVNENPQIQHIGIAVPAEGTLNQQEEDCAEGAIDKQGIE